MCIPTSSHLTYNNDKPWFTAKLRQRHQAKEDARMNGDRLLYKQAKYTLEKGDQSGKEELFWKAKEPILKFGVRIVGFLGCVFWTWERMVTDHPGLRVQP